MFQLKDLINQSFIDIKIEFNLCKFSYINSWLYKFGSRKKFYYCLPYYMFGNVSRKYNTPNPFGNNNALRRLFCLSTKIKLLFFSFLGFIWNHLRIIALVLLREISQWKKTFKLFRYQRKIFRNFFKWFSQK